MKPHLAALVAQAKAKHAAAQAALAEKAGLPAASSPTHLHVKKDMVQAPSVQKHFTSGGVFNPTIPGFDYNEKQLQAIELAIRGKSMNLIGAAGTGKTTTTREIIGQVVRLPQCLPIHSSTKYLVSGAPGVVIISFTNKAVNNIKKFLPPELKKHCLTIHSLLEFKPVRAFDPMEQEERDAAGNFMPSYWKGCKLPHISCVIVEESSMVGWEDHWKWVMDALPRPEETQFIFLGDINQLPPIFGPSVLGFKMLELPTVELTHVYRQALESPIITLAHKIREGRSVGKLIPFEADGTGGFKDDRGDHGLVTIHPWKKKLDSIKACNTTVNFVEGLHKRGVYNPETDVILCPFNKSFGTLELNKGIADYLGKLRGALVYEVVSRGQFTYWAVGDRVLVDRQEAVITKIEETPGYVGRQPDDPSYTLNRWGKDPAKKKQVVRHDAEDLEILKAQGMDILDTLEVGDDEEKKNAASHTITVEFCDTGVGRAISASGDVNAMLFSYALTIHKSQGSEWKKVFLFLHYSHNTMLTRELIYTAVTRARHELFIICEPDRTVSGSHIPNSLNRASKNPEIKGVTLQEKAEYFMAKKKSMQRMEDKVSSKQKQEKLDLEEMEDSEEEPMTPENKEVIQGMDNVMAKMRLAIKKLDRVI